MVQQHNESHHARRDRHPRAIARVRALPNAARHGAGALPVLLWMVAITLLMALLLASAAQAAAAQEGERAYHYGDQLDLAAADFPDTLRDPRGPNGFDALTAAKGHLLYQEHCASCHGYGGRGDGPLAHEMKPRPTDLMVFITAKGKKSTDAVHLQLNETREGLGGNSTPPSQHPAGNRHEHGAGMPVFKTVLSSEQRWQILAFIRGWLMDHPSRREVPAR